MKGYSTREVSEALGFPTSTILAWARGGLITPTRGPRGAYVFSFQDIAVLRAARELLEAELSARSVREALERLRDQMPAGRPLSAVHLEALGRRVLVRDRGTLWEPATGQLQLDLDAAPTAGEPGEPPGEPEIVAHRFRGPLGGEPGSPARTADEWYDRAVELEGSSPDAAKDAYRRALEAAPNHPDAHVNLGRLLHEEGDLDQAERHYRAALRADPSSARAHYNLGVALEDRGRIDAAVEAYEAALQLDGELAVAHFNLSRLFESSGASTEALRHLAAYKRLLDRGAGPPT